MVVGGKLERLRLDGLVGLSDDGLDALLGDDGLEAAAAAPAAAAAARAAAARAAAASAASSSDGGGASPPAAAADGDEQEASASSSLRVLSLSECRGVTDQGLARLGASRPLRASLRELDVSGTSTTEAGLLRLLDPSSAESSSSSGGAAVGRRRPAPLRLESLVLQHGGGGITGAGLSALAGLTSLTRLDLEGCRGPGVTSQALAGG